MILDAVILAAGSGSRFGGEKLTAPWRGGVLLDGALGAALRAPLDKVIVVHGADLGVAAAAGAFFAKHHASYRLRLVHARAHADGMSASLKAGIEAAPRDRNGVIVFLGDMPNIPPAVVPDLIAALRGDARAVAPVWQGRRGHPVLFSRSVFPDLMACRGDQGAREVLRSLGDLFVTVTADDEGVITDVDDRSDLDRLEFPC